MLVQLDQFFSTMLTIDNTASKRIFHPQSGLDSITREFCLFTSGFVHTVVHFQFVYVRWLRSFQQDNLANDGAGIQDLLHRNVFLSAGMPFQPQTSNSLQPYKLASRCSTYILCSVGVSSLYLVMICCVPVVNNLITLVRIEAHDSSISLSFSLGF